MKNLFNIYIKNSRENSARFLFDTFETINRDAELAKKEVIKGTKEKTLPLLKESGIQQIGIEEDLKKLSSQSTKKKGVENSAKSVTEGKEVKETDEGSRKTTTEQKQVKKAVETQETEPQLDPKLKEELKEKAVEASNKYLHPKVQSIAENTEMTMEQKIIEIEKLTKEIDEPSYLEHLDKIILKQKGIPNDWKNWAKGAGVLSALGFITKEGTMKERAGSALKWGAWTALLTHPAVTQTIAHVGKGIGYVGSRSVLGVANTISLAISNPTALYNAFKESLNTKSSTPIANLLIRNKTAANKVGEALATSQNPVYLWKNGMKFSPDLTEVIVAMDAFDKKNIAPSPQVIQKAAKFMAQSDAIELSDEELVKFQGTLLNEESLSLEDMRKTIVTTTRKAIQKFVNDSDQQDDFSFKLAEAKEKLNLPAGVAGKLDKIKVGNLEEFIATKVKTEGDFAKMKEKLTQGIDGVLKAPGASILKALIIIFLGINGVMKGSKLFQKGWDKTEKVREKLKKKPISTILGAAWYPFGKAKQGIVWTAKRPFKFIKRKNILNIGEKHYTWGEGEKNAWNKLSRTKKNKVVDNLRKLLRKKKNDTDEKMEKLRLKYKKDKKWWSIFKKGTDTKGLQADSDYELLLKEVEQLKKGVLKGNGVLEETEWNSIFSGIPDDIKSILSTKTK